MRHERPLSLRQALLAALAAGLAALGARGAEPKRAAAPVLASPESSAEEICRLGREALARGSFQTAVRLFRAVEEEPRYQGDSRYAFNRAQACRYANDPGEAVYWYGRYLALEPNAADAKAVKEQAVRLAKASPRPVREAALQRSRADYARLLADPEIERALAEAPRITLNVRFVKAAAGAPTDAEYVYPGRAVFFRSPPDESPGGLWSAWVVPSIPVSAPEGLAAPPLLFLPPGRAIAVELGEDGVSRPLQLETPLPPFFPADPDLAVWRIEAVVQIEKTGPPVLVVGAGPAGGMVEVRSGPFEGGLVLGKKRRDFPPGAGPVSFGPRLVKADSKLFARVPFLVLDLTGKEGSVERWGAPLARFDVANRFGRLVSDSAGGLRLTLRADGTGPSIPVVKPPAPAR